MATTSPNSLLDALRQHRLLDFKQLEELDSFHLPDPKALAKELIQRGWLTPYQANQLLNGKSHELVLGSYILLERLGEGGMGQVFKARHRKLGRIAAIKLIRKERLDNPNAVKRFQREVRSASALSHPNIVLAYDADEIAGTHFMVMEYIEGAIDLAKLVKKNGPLPVAHACEYIRHAALGLQHANERGMVHRDIKPANLLLTASGLVVKILDMGLARLDHTSAEGESSGTMTQEGTVMGTPDYMAPEQAMESHTVDIRADLYSLGCTFYFLLTGQVPFPGGSLMERLLKHRLNEPKPVNGLRPDVPPGVTRVVRKLMAKKPEDRYQTPAEVATALASVGVGDESSLVGTGSEQTAVAEGKKDSFYSALETIGKLDDTVALDSPGQLPRQIRKRNRVLFGVAGGSFVLVATVVLAFWLKSHPVANKSKEERKDVTAVAMIPAPAKVGDPKPLEGNWYYLGPFDNPEGTKGFDTVYPPEQAINLNATYQGKNDQPIRWKEHPGFQVGVPLDFPPLYEKPEQKEWICTYLYHEIDVAEETFLPISLGSAGTLTIWLNEERLLHLNVKGSISPNDRFAMLKLKPGKNKLLVKICQGVARWSFYIASAKESDLPFYMRPGFDSWCTEVAALPAEKQVDAVAAKLKEINPGFDGTVTHKVSEDGGVTELTFVTDKVRDISPVRALVGLKKLSCKGTSVDNKGKLSDLSPLEGMKLTSLDVYVNLVWGLSPLTEMKLTSLGLYRTLVRGTVAAKRYAPYPLELLI